MSEDPRHPGDPDDDDDAPRNPGEPQFDDPDDTPVDEEDEE